MTQTTELEPSLDQRRKHVLMLTQDVSVDRRILLQAGALRSDGWEVTIVAMPREGQRGVDPIGVVRAAVPSDSAARERAVLRLYRLVRGQLPMDGALMRRLKSLAWRTMANPVTFYAKLLGDTARRFPADIVVAHDLPVLPLAGELAKRCGAGLVYDSHELFLGRPMSDGERRRWQDIEHQWLGCCDAVITVNRSIAGELRRRYGRDVVHTITNAEQPLRSNPHPEGLRGRAGVPPNSRLVLYQGGLLAGRNLEMLVDSMREVRDATIHLVLLGDGSLGRALERRVRRTRLERRVWILPAVPQEELLPLTASACVGIVPYVPNCLNNLYCTPNKLYEFVAAGVPVLSNDLPEIRALVDAWGLGWIASLDTPRAIARALEACFADPEAYRRCREAVKIAREQLSWDVEAVKLRGIYRQVAESTTVRNGTADRTRRGVHAPPMGGDR